MIELYVYKLFAFDVNISYYVYVCGTYRFITIYMFLVLSYHYSAMPISWDLIKYFSHTPISTISAIFAKHVAAMFVGLAEVMSLGASLVASASISCERCQ